MAKIANPQILGEQNGLIACSADFVQNDGTVTPFSFEVDPFILDGLNKTEAKAALINAFKEQAANTQDHLMRVEKVKTLVALAIDLGIEITL